MDGAEGVRLHDLFGNKDGILVVVPVPWHERAQEVYAERELTLVGGRAVRNDLSRRYVLAQLDDGLLRVAGVLVRALVLEKPVHVLIPLGLIRLDPVSRGSSRC